MRIKLSPVLPLPGVNDTLEVVKSDDILTINGIECDFSAIPDGATLPADAVDCYFIIDKVERIAGDLHLTLLFPVASTSSEAARFPADIINPANGLIGLPQ